MKVACKNQCAALRLPLVFANAIAATLCDTHSPRPYSIPAVREWLALLIWNKLVDTNARERELEMPEQETGCLEDIHGAGVIRVPSFHDGPRSPTG
jgi:hypothetical protein